MFRDPIIAANQLSDETGPALGIFGFKMGPKGAHTSRTIMLAELSMLFMRCPLTSPRADYVKAVVDENCLGKHTLSTRQLTFQRMTELYGIDPSVPIFRLMRLFWDADEKAHPLLAVLAAMARDPLLRATAPVVFGMKIGDEVARQTITDALHEAAGGRFNDDTLDKVVRNTLSSWTQSGHLEGRSHKCRVAVKPTPTSTAFALLLGFFLGARGRNLFDTIFSRALDRDAGELTSLAADARRLGFLDIKSGGGMMTLSFDSILTEQEKKLIYGQN